MVLLPTFRLPTLIHTRSGNAKWLYEISHTNPLWLHPEDAARLGVDTGDLLEDRHRDRLLRRQGVGDRGDPARASSRARITSGRWRLSETPAASAGRPRSSICSGSAPGPVADAPAARRAPVQERRPRLRARVVGGRRRPPEPDVPGAAGSGERPALLAPEGHRDAGRGPTTATATSSSTPTGRSRSTASGWRRRGRRPAPATCAGRCGCRARSSPTPAPTDWSDGVAGTSTGRSGGLTIASPSGRPRCTADAASSCRRRHSERGCPDCSASARPHAVRLRFVQAEPGRLASRSHVRVAGRSAVALSRADDLRPDSIRSLAIWEWRRGAGDGEDARGDAASGARHARRRRAWRRPRA